MVGFVIGINPHLRFAFEFQSGGNSSLIYIADGSLIVFAHPFPEFQLWKTQNGLIVEQTNDFFGFVKGRSIAVCQADNRRVHFFCAERNNHTHTNAHHVSPLVGNNVSESRRQRQGHYDINVFHAFRGFRLHPLRWSLTMPAACIKA